MYSIVTMPKAQKLSRTLSPNDASRHPSVPSVIRCGPGHGTAARGGAAITLPAGLENF